MTPRINNKPFYKLTIPELSGGVNYRDGISHVLDNQLTDCNNVWYKNGLLRTRPSVTCTNEEEFDEKIVETDFLPAGTSAKRLYIKKENFRVVNGKTYFLVVFQYNDKLVLRYYSDHQDFVHIADIDDLPQGEFTCNIFQHGADIYCFCSGYYDTDTPYYIFKISETQSTENWNDNFSVKRIRDEDLYIPTIAMNCKPYIEGDGAFGKAAFNGDMIEGYNLLGNVYKLIYSTARIDEDSIQMRYVLAYDLHESAEFAGKTVTAVITDKEGKEYTHSVTITDKTTTGKDTYDIEEKSPGDNLYLGVKNDTLVFFTDKSGSKIASITKDKYVLNNMVITVPCQNVKENYEKVLNMTFCEWFGGGSEGIYGGIHLFLGGNISDKEKALVCWSDFNRPLYFSESSYAYVGDKAQKVTAFGKQGEALIIFKERETYATQYSSRESVIDAAAVMGQSVIDVTAAEVTFPMIQVHGFIGCDCPHTVQLCRNRLVWAHSDRKIYTLVSADRWSERSIFEVSGMVEKKLFEFEPDDLKGALSADWEGHYILSARDKFFLMDYNSYGYANVSSFSKEDDAQLRIPWWIWDKPKYNMHTYHDAYPATESYIETEEKPLDILSMVTIGERLYMVVMLRASVDGGGSAYYPEIVLFGGESQEDEIPDIFYSEHSMSQFKERKTVKKEIPFMVQTKLFDFGDPTIKKSVPRAEISFGANGGQPITVTITTDKGQSEQAVVVQGSSEDERQADFFDSVVIRNLVKQNNRIGYRFESTGNLLIDAFSVYYKQLEGAK